MPDRRIDTGAPEQARVTPEQRHEIERFAERHGLSIDEAREIIEEAGSREKADELAWRRTGR